MKRLLAYLFIVLGLGLTSNVYYVQIAKAELNQKENSNYNWNGTTVSKSLYCFNAKNANMHVYDPHKWEWLCGSDINTQIAKQEEFKPTICAGVNNYRFIYKQSEIKTCEINSAFHVISKDHSMYEWYASRMPKTSDKKTEVTKVEEPKQEEFKPKTKDIDNDAPVIVPAAETVILAEAFLPIRAEFSRSAAYITVAIPDPLLYPAPGLMTLKPLTELKLCSTSVNRVTVVLPVPVITAPVAAKPTCCPCMK